MNGEDFKGSITLDEARYAIFSQALRPQGSLLNSGKINYDKVRLIKMKLILFKKKKKKDFGRVLYLDPTNKILIQPFTI